MQTNSHPKLVEQRPPRSFPHLEGHDADVGRFCSEKQKDGARPIEAGIAQGEYQQLLVQIQTIDGWLQSALGSLERYIPACFSDKPRRFSADQFTMLLPAENPWKPCRPCHSCAPIM